MTVTGAAEGQEGGAIVNVDYPHPLRGSWRRREAVESFVWIAPAFLYLAFFIAYPFYFDGRRARPLPAA